MQAPSDATTTPRRHAAGLTSPARVGGARYQHKLETLAALRAAALQLALHQGLETITATDIATAAGVSRRTFFNYFASKEDALVGETPQLATFLREAITTRPAAEPPLTAVQTALLETAAAYITNDVRDRIRTRHHLLTAHPELLGRHLARYAAFEHLLTEALTTRTRHHTPPRIEPGLLATLIAGTARWCTHQWAEHGDPPLTQRLDTALSSLRTGLG